MTANPLADQLDQRGPLIPAPCTLTIFGATGDLAHRKLLPAIYDLANRGLLPAGFGLICLARADRTPAEFLAQVHSSLASGARTPFRQRVWEQLSGSITYISADATEPETYPLLRKAIQRAGRVLGSGSRRAFYLATPPAIFGQICQHLAGSGLARPGRAQPGPAKPEAAQRRPATRKLIIEKPVGHDLVSAEALERTIATAFDPRAVFRINHQLGRQTIHAMAAVRFANQVFEPLWSGEHIDHVQITLAEDLGTGPNSQAYDQTGAIRDQVVTSLLQLMAITAMDQPESFAADDLRAARLAALQTARLAHPSGESAVLGQYTAGWQGNLAVRGYLEEAGVAAGSTTETYAALKVLVPSARWRDTPFYLRAGKRLGRHVTEVAIVFRDRAAKLPPGLDQVGLGANTLVIRTQPDEGVTLKLGLKVPQTDAAVRDLTIDFAYGHAFTESLPDTYERELLDVLTDVDPLFASAEEAAEAWRIVDPVLARPATTAAITPEPYAPGTWGPAAADQLTGRDGRRWRRP
jgi:glucose-6-phosphate 1-dehydrogenase